MARPKIHPHTYNCVECNKESIYRVSKNNLYCSTTCQATSQYKKYVNDWKNGEISGAGVNGPSSHIKRYLLDKYNNSCYTCGINSWNDKPIKLEVEHIDGDSTNNTEDNLAVICPNCHSQTSTYKNKNKGNGRHSRRVRYLEGKSY